jgi:hypothetical protein
VIQSAEIEAEGSRSGPRNCGAAALVVCLLVGGIGLALQLSASSRLDAKLLEASQEITRLQELGARPRTTLLGPTSGGQNAVVDYAGVEWILKGGQAGSRVAWQQQRPELPSDVDEVLAQVAPKGSLSYPDLDELLRGISPNRPLTNLSPEDAAAYAKAQALFRQYQPVLRYVRAGLARGHCDWEVEWGRGVSGDLPSLLALRSVSVLLAYEASQQEPSAALQTGLEILAFGSDVARLQHMTGTNVSTRVTMTGLRSLAHTLNRDGISAQDCERFLEVTARYQPLRNLTVLDAERILILSLALGASGRPLDPRITADLEEFPDAGLLGFDLGAAREIEAYEAQVQRLREHLGRPRGERMTAAPDLLEGQGSGIVRLSDGTLTFFDSLEVTDAHLPPLRVLAAARLMQLRGGELPAQLSQLTTLLGQGGGQDPYASPPAPLRYSLEGRTLRCWSVGLNGADDGGPTRYVQGQATPRTDDLGFSVELKGE